MTKPIRRVLTSRLYGETKIVEAVLAHPQRCPHCGAPSGQYCRGGTPPVFCAIRVTRAKQGETEV